MEVVHLSYPLQAEATADLTISGQTLAIGDFDGVHLGHREVIRLAVEEAKSKHMPSAVMTFHPHPREVLGSKVYASYLTPMHRKIKQFEQLGVDRVYIVQFDQTLSQLSPSEFVDHYLRPLRIQFIVVGFNFTFGRGGTGTSDSLKELGAGCFDVRVVEPYKLDGERVSSTLVRGALAKGDVAFAGKLLGRPYEVCGEVVRGEGRGSRIGVPTANIEPDGAYVVPETGVYAVTIVMDDGEQLRGVMNLGKKPTFHADLPKPTWEVHLFHFDSDIYGRKLTILFQERIRNERKFESVDALISQIQDDIQRAKQLLGCVDVAK